MLAWAKTNIKYSRNSTFLNYNEPNGNKRTENFQKMQKKNANNNFLSSQVGGAAADDDDAAGSPSDDAAAGAAAGGAMGGISSVTAHASEVQQ
jgi:hypothetical protein